MARPAKKRIPIRIDMTPMVDIAFLLLIFFMATTQFKPPESVPINLPGSHSNLKLPESDVLLISVDKENKTTLSLGSPNLDAQAGFMKPNERGQLRPTYYSAEEIGERIQQARLRNLKIRLILKADKEAEFGAVEDVMSALQKINMNRFNMVTELEVD